ncbi:MAG: transcriptional repressor [Candidatus Omnitrophica bacterium]|nr:transcriptional repressor [Candidatus Omnitrophota bacterium]
MILIHWRDNFTARQNDAAMNEKNIRAILRKANLRCTRGRVDVLQVLLESPDPTTHEDLHKKLQGTGINRVTVYRVLETLQKSGIVHRVEAGDRIWRFAVCGRMHPGHCHPHFICRQCGKIECLKEFPMPDMPSVAKDYTVEEQEMYLRGICPNCASKIKNLKCK